MDIGPSGAETPAFAEAGSSRVVSRKLRRRPLRGVKLVVSDAHEGIEAAAAKIMPATWRRCRVPFLRNAPAHAGKSGRRGVSAFIATAFAQDEAPSASAPWRPKLPKRATPMDEAEPDVLAYMSLPAAHRTKLHAPNPIGRLNGSHARHPGGQARIARASGSRRPLLDRTLRTLTRAPSRLCCDAGQDGCAGRLDPQGQGDHGGIVRPRLLGLAISAINKRLEESLEAFATRPLAEPFAYLHPRRPL